ncbi:MAG: hypothetical protein E3J43_07955 [Candidatus Heimdallarchaeota archaeon]|nr:MAG: hypothetical protein E3J43_07955 [Candidatus Heimdallarchaeota archaeon]
MHSAFIVLIIFASCLTLLFIFKGKQIFSKSQGEGYSVQDENAEEVIKRETFLQESSGPLMARTSGIGRSTSRIRGGKDSKKRYK